MAKKKDKKAADPEPVPTAGDEELENKRREFFCRYYAQGEGTFGNATLSYAAAYDIELGDLSRYDKLGNLIIPRETNRLTTCAAQTGVA